jgi:hypothetical protein
VDLAASGRIKTFFPCSSKVFIGNGCFSICMLAKLNRLSLIASCICRRNTL